MGMKLLLTSQMITNDSIAKALAELLGRPFVSAKVTYILTSHNGATGEKSWLMENLNSIYRLGWAKFYMLDVAGMDGLPRSIWQRWLEDSDVIVMGGGANYILSYWLERSGLMADLPQLLQERVYVGSSAGSMVATHKLCTSSEAMKAYANGTWDFDLATLGVVGRASTAALGLVDFNIRPHYMASHYPYITDDLLAQVAKRTATPLYALDDDSALRVVDGDVEAVSEGNWKLFSA